MKKKFLAVIIVWMFLFMGCSEGHRRHRGHPIVIRPSRPHYKQRVVPVCHRGPRIVVGSHGPKMGQRGPYRGQRGPHGPMTGKGPGRGKGHGRGKGK